MKKLLCAVAVLTVSTAQSDTINAANLGGCGVPGTGDCLLPNGTPFCDDTCGAPAKPCKSCCYIVCAVDPFCCDAVWDTFCAVEAEELCLCATVEVPPNDDCINAIEVFVGPALSVSTKCGTSGGPAHKTCTDGFVGMGIDVWYIYNATFNGTLTITPTPLKPLLWHTQLAVYDGTNCLALSDPPFVCADVDGSAVVPVTDGASYLIRLGGSFTGPVGVGTLELSAVLGSCPWDCGGDNNLTVGIVDFLALLEQWTMINTSCDFDGGGVGIVDFLDLLGHWGPCQ